MRAHTPTSSKLQIDVIVYWWVRHLMMTYSAYSCVINTKSPNFFALCSRLRYLLCTNQLRTAMSVQPSSSFLFHKLVSVWRNRWWKWTELICLEESLCQRMHRFFVRLDYLTFKHLTSCNWNGPLPIEYAFTYTYPVSLPHTSFPYPLPHPAKSGNLSRNDEKV